MTLLPSELKERARADDLLYNSFGQYLEADHLGQYVAIAKDGRLIAGENDMEVLREAVQKFGSGNFTFRKIGSKVLGKWRSFLGC
ncbi:MAG: DUF5678 domain-containing protein [Dehalococcoidia bacterium]|nr:hypothetical protein [Chloroflexota bacterium]MBT9158841.1 hypothetical protein [Chloroflexota bacterium]MBT9161899.1 hypothetical protein [Chloroflexota bacterium]